MRGADRRMYLCRNEDLVVKKWRRYLELVIIVSPPALEMHKTRQRHTRELHQFQTGRMHRLQTRQSDAGRANAALSLY